MKNIWTDSIYINSIPYRVINKYIPIDIGYCYN